MRRISELISYVPLAFLVVALASTVGDWRMLMETGGWFALLGNFLMVSATLVLLYIAAMLILCLAALPFILLFARNEDDFFALAKAIRSCQSPGALFVVCRQMFVRLLFAMINPLWKAIWWCWWYLRGGALADTRRNGG